MLQLRCSLAPVGAYKCGAYKCGAYKCGAYKCGDQKCGAWAMIQRL